MIGRGRRKLIGDCTLGRLGDRPEEGQVRRTYVRCAAPWKHGTGYEIGPEAEHAWVGQEAGFGSRNPVWRRKRPV